MTSQLLHRFSVCSKLTGALALIVLVGSVSAQELRLRCTHSQGERLYKGSHAIALERSGHAVSVRMVPSGEDIWTYRILFEESSLGFRAVRVGRLDGGSTPYDTLLGGELIYLIDGADRRLLVTALNAANGQASSALLACRNAP